MDWFDKPIEKIVLWTESYLSCESKHKMCGDNSLTQTGVGTWGIIGAEQSRVLTQDCVKGRLEGFLICGKIYTV